MAKYVSELILEIVTFENCLKKWQKASQQKNIVRQSLTLRSKILELWDKLNAWGAWALEATQKKRMALAKKFAEAENWQIIQITGKIFPEAPGCLGGFSSRKGLTK